MSADIFTDGHDVIVAVLLHRPIGAADWSEVPMTFLSNDRWTGRFTVTKPRWHRVLDPGLGRSLPLLAQGVGQEARGLPAGPHQRAPGRGDARPRGGRARPGPGRRLAPRAGPLPGRAGEPIGRASGRDSTASWSSGCHGTRTSAGSASMIRSSTSWWSESGPGSGPGTRCSPAPRPRSRAGTAPSATSRRGCRTSRAWASTSSTFPRSIRSAGAFRKGPNNTLTAGPNDPGSPWAIGAARGGPQGHPSRAGDVRGLRSPGGRGAGDGHRDRAGYRLPVLARPSLRPRASPVVPASPRRHDQVRREPAQEVSGHLSDRLRVRTTGRPSGTSCATSSSSGSTTACRSSAWTTRIPSRSRSGTG